PSNSDPALISFSIRLIRGFFTENQQIPIWIPDLEFPVTIRLLPQRLHDRRLFPHGLKKVLHSLDSKVSIPNSARARVVEIRLLVTLNALQHDLDLVAIHDRKHVRPLWWKRIANETKLFLVPADGRRDVGHCEHRRYGMKFSHLRVSNGLRISERTYNFLLCT